MKLATKVANRLQTLSHLIQQPALISLYRNTGSIEAYIKLNQPWFQALEIATVLDIGANVGKFAFTIKKLLPKALIYSFEPLPECYKEMQERMMGADRFTAFNIGIGDEEGELSLEKNSFTPSSSFLKITDKHIKAFPETKNIEKVRVEITSLDKITKGLLIVDPLMIKVDVQGYEDRVVSGGKVTIERAKLLILETSFERLYEEQPLFDNLYCELTSLGFAYAGAFSQLYSPINGLILQQDSLFIRKNK